MYYCEIDGVEQQNLELKHFQDIKNVMSEKLLENLCKNKIENSCHWTAELIAWSFCGLWEIILYILVNIYVRKSKLAIYIEMDIQILKIY